MLMKVKALKPFADKVTYRMYSVGEVIDLPDGRASIAIKNGLVESVEKAITPVKKKARAKKKED